MADDRTRARARERERVQCKNAPNEWEKKHKRAQMEYKMRKYLALIFASTPMDLWRTHTQQTPPKLDREARARDKERACVFECNGIFVGDMTFWNATSMEWRMVFWHHAWVYCHHHHEHEKIFLINISKYLHKFMYSLAVMISIGRCWCLKSI